MPWIWEVFFIKKRFIIIALILIFVVSIFFYTTKFFCSTKSSCAANFSSKFAKNIPTKTIVASVISAYPDLPAVLVFYSGAHEYEEGYLSEDMLITLYGDGQEVLGYEGVEECALFIAKGQDMTEFAIFKCYTYASTEKVAEMCRRRLEILKMNDDSGIEIAESAEIITEGKYVAFIVLPETETAARIVRSLRK